MDVKLIIIIVSAVVAVALIVVFVVFGRGEANFTFDIGGASPRAAGGSDTSGEKTVGNRLVGLAVGVAGIFAVLIARLWSMQLVSSDEYAAEAESNRTRTITTDAPRGRILDRNGTEIVTNRSSLTVVSSSDVVDDEIEVQLLANLIGMPFQAVRRKIQDTSEGAQSKRTISVDVSRRVVAFIAEHPGVFDGVDVVERSQRSYPLGSLAAHVIGYTGTVTSAQLEANDSEATGITYESGDIVGQSGIESEYESVLQGVKGEQTVYVDANGNVLDTSTTIDPQSGSDVILTIDATIQTAAEQSLATRMKEIQESGYNATGACVVCVDCTNGEVLAMASAPTYNPNVFVGGISTADWDALSSETANYPLMNRAIAGQYPSGSTIKALTSFAALDHGIADTSSSWYCTGYWTWSGNENDTTSGWHCWYKSGHGTMTFVTGITNSCDVVFYSIGKGFYYSDTQEGMQETFRRYGLGSSAVEFLTRSGSGTTSRAPRTRRAPGRAATTATSPSARATFSSPVSRWWTPTAASRTMAPSGGRTCSRASRRGRARARSSTTSPRSSMSRPRTRRIATRSARVFMASSTRRPPRRPCTGRISTSTWRARRARLSRTRTSPSVGS